jgi:hypothetical protein
MAGRVAQVVEPSKHEALCSNPSSKKIKHYFMTKALQKAGIEGMYFNIIKTTHDKHIPHT